MEQPTIPDLFCPFPSAINQHAERVDQQTIAWAERFRLLPTTAAYQHLGAARVGWLMARAYPTTLPEPLQLLTDWSTWLLVWDDVCTESELANRPDQLAVLARRYLGVLNGAPVAGEDTALAHALCDLRLRLRPTTTSIWRARFLSRVEEFFDACIWEATNRAQGIIPDVTTYIEMRPMTGGLLTYVELLEITERITLPVTAQSHPLVQRLTRQANNVVCWINDLISLGKELRHGEIHNLVLILRRQYHLTLQQAINRTAALHNAEVRAFLDTTSQLPSFGAEVDATVSRYIAALQAWMRGSLDWSYTSGRYLKSETDTEPGAVWPKVGPPRG